MYVYGERAEWASLENFGIFTFSNCYFFQYFFGTLKISHGWILFGGGGKRPPSPPPVRQCVLGSQIQAVLTGGGGAS